MKSRLRLAVLFDAVEEGWRSMDYCAEMLVKHLQQEHAETFETVAITPRFFGGFEKLASGKGSFNADRAVTRFVTYPANLLPRRREFDLFHIADHTYAHLTHVLPRGRTGVYCHDLDAFEPTFARDGRSPPIWRRAMATVQLRGLQRAAVVFHSTRGMRGSILDHGLIPAERLVEAPLGIAEEFWEATSDDIPPSVRGPFLLHVGANFPRKRLDVLFRVFAEVHRERPDLRLVQQGATLSPGDHQLIRSLGIGDALVQPGLLSREQLAALYSGAELLLVPSESEGFGLPLLEALASGAAVVASDLPVLREVGGDAVTYCPVADVGAWSAAVARLLHDPASRPTLEARHGQARRFSWRSHAARIASAYRQLASAA